MKFYMNIISIYIIKCNLFMQDDPTNSKIIPFNENSIFFNRTEKNLLSSDTFSHQMKY